MDKRFALILTGFIMYTNFAFAHGEDKYGPNGGFVRMPGGFHVEIVPVNKNTLNVFLLDIEWKNPSVKTSSVAVTLNSKPKKNAKCEMKDNFYKCTFLKLVDLTKQGELIVQAQRDGQKGMPVKYRLPLKLE